MAESLGPTPRVRPWPASPSLSALPESQRSSAITSRVWRRPRRFSGRKLLLRLLFFCINVYSLASFVLTSSVFYSLWPTSSVFLHDLHNGLYVFEPRRALDRVILREIQAETGVWGNYLLTLGFQDRQHNRLGSASHCHRLGVDAGSTSVVTYYGEGNARRLLKKFHGALPHACTGYTVALGQSYDAQRMEHVDDARHLLGQSFLNCSDRILALPQRLNSSPEPITQPAPSSFAFKASYVIVQQHFANAYYGVECQVSYCVARRVPNVPGIWEVQPADPTDTRAYVSVFFTAKPILLSVLDVGGQSLVLFVITRELWRLAFGDRNVRIPVQRPAVDLLHQPSRWLGLPVRSESPGTTSLDAGPSRLRLSKVWLASPFYMLGNVAQALGTTVESQMAVEVHYWQYSRSGNLRDLLFAGIYSMRHAWVGLALCSCSRLLLRAILKPRPGKHASRDWYCVLRHLHGVLLYTSPKPFILAFFLAAIVAVHGRGVLFLWGQQELSDVGLGVLLRSFWGSEVAQSLLFQHGVAQIIAYVVALALRAVCRSAWPGHERNSFLRAINAHTWWTSFDVTDFLLAVSAREDDAQRLLLHAPLSDIYGAFSTLRVLGPSLYVQCSSEKVLASQAVVELELKEDGLGGWVLHLRHVATDSSTQGGYDDQEDVDDGTVQLTLR